MVSRTDVDIINRKSVFYFVHMDMQEIYETQHALGFRHVHTTVTQDYDDTSATRFSKTLPRLDAALDHAERQVDFFSPQAKPMGETDFDCGWPFKLTR